jgi:threonine dehydrogenase-like Zn-dependent dehydrogenase
MRTTTAIAVVPGQPGTLQQIQVDVPPAGPEDVLIDVIRCGVCGTDREVAQGHVGGPPPGQQRIVLGHELLGRVSVVGDAVQGVQPGDLVTATVRRPDGCPSCQAGEIDMCQWHEYEEHGIQGLDGFLAGQVVVNQRWVIPVPAHLEAVGVLIEPLTVVEKAVRHAHLLQRRIQVWEPKVAVVTGAGPVGILGTLLLRSMGMEVYTVARTPAPNAAATVVEGAGARYISSREEPLADLAARVGPVDIILECTGASAVAFEAMRALGPNGVLALISITDGAARQEIGTGAINNSLVTGNKVVFGSINAGMEDFAAAATRLGAFEERWPGLAASMITHRIPVDGDLAGILDEPEDAIKVVVEFAAV